MSLNVNERQRALIIAAAQSITPPWRERFLACVTDLLLPRKQIGDGDVQVAVDMALKRMTVPSER
jgi:hypothetical protein